MDNFPESKRELGLDYEPVWCGHCNGSGRMVRDPDIGTDQECFVCDGAGVPAAPVQEPVVQNICIECANADSWGLPDKPACRSCVSNSEWKPLNVSSKNPATPPVQEPAEVLGHNGWGFPIKAAAPVQEDWGPGPHECHSLTAAPVQDIGVEQDERVFARIEARKNRDAAHKETAQRQWVGLTQQDIDIAFDDTQEGGGFNEFARAIEAKLKEKNT